MFGLGDSSYVQFNFAAKKLFRRLLALGAQAFYEKGEGDDQHKLGPDGALDPWLTGMFGTLCARHPLLPGMQPLASSHCPSSRYIVVELLQSQPVAPASMDAPQQSYTQKHPFVSSLVKNERITAADWEQDVRHLEFSIKGIVRHLSPAVRFADLRRRECVL